MEQLNMQEIQPTLPIIELTKLGVPAHLTPKLKQGSGELASIVLSITILIGGISTAICIVCVRYKRWDLTNPQTLHIQQNTKKSLKHHHKLTSSIPQFTHEWTNLWIKARTESINWINYDGELRSIFVILKYIFIFLVPSHIFQVLCNKTLIFELSRREKIVNVSSKKNMTQSETIKVINVWPKLTQNLLFLEIISRWDLPALVDSPSSANISSLCPSSAEH